MNVRIFWVRAMKCMCAQTRPQFILSSERVFGGMEFEPMLTPREKSPLPENFPRGGSNPRRCGQQAKTLPTSYSAPSLSFWEWRFCRNFPTLYCTKKPHSPGRGRPPNVTVTVYVPASYGVKTSSKRSSPASRSWHGMALPRIFTSPFSLACPATDLSTVGVTNIACVTRFCVAVLCRGWESETMLVLECQCCCFVQRSGARNNACVTRVCVAVLCRGWESETLPVLQDSVSLFCAEIGSQKHCMCYKSQCCCFVQRLGVRNTTCVTRVCVAVLCRGWESETLHVLQKSVLLFCAEVGSSVLLFCAEVGDRNTACNTRAHCCHTETEVADQTSYLTQPHHTDTRPTCWRTDP